MIKRLRKLSEAEEAALGIITNAQFHATIRERYAKSFVVRSFMAKNRPWMLYDWEKPDTMESGKSDNEVTEQGAKKS